MLIDVDESQLVLVDFQPKLQTAMHDASAVWANAARLAQAARLLQVPVWGTEQNPSRLGALPPELRDQFPLENCTKSEMLFKHNNSSIRVATSVRGGTIHRLHVSEFGKICAKYPDKAKEVMTGSIPAVPKSGIIVVESTAEGQEGEVDCDGHSLPPSCGACISIPGGRQLWLGRSVDLQPTRVAASRIKSRVFMAGIS